MFFELINESAPHYPIAFGIECGDGWYNLLDKLFSDIVKICDEKNIEIPKVTQIKEKFGSLRFYVGATTEEIHQLIGEAEAESYVTCEVCGSPGSIVKNHGWIMVRCETCLNNK